MHVLRPKGDAWIENFQPKFVANDINRTWATTASHRGKRHPKCVRRTAADPEAAAQNWQGTFSEQRFERPPQPQPANTTTPVFSTQDISEGAKI